MAYRPSDVRFVEHGTITITAVAGVPVTAVYNLANTFDLNYSAVELLGFYGADSNNTIAVPCTVELTSATQVTVTNYSSVNGTFTVMFSVIQFHPAVVRSRQTWSVVMTESGSATGNATMSPTLTTLSKARMFWGGCRASGTVVSGNSLAAAQAAAYLVSVTTVTANRFQATGVGCTCVGTVIEFK